MNARLQELMLEAGYAAPELAGRAQLLAELIIADCCQAVHPMLRDQISRGQAVDLIRQHFGVER